MNYTEEFIKKGKFSENDSFIKDNLLYETILGSHAYGCSNLTSDFDIVGIFMDRHIDLYPQEYGMIIGFSEINRFKSKEIKGAGKRIVLDNGRDCEAEWHSLTDFMYLTGIKGSPPLVEALFTKRNLVTVSSDIGWMLRDNRKLFISAKTFHAFKGYAFGQLSKIRKGFLSKKADNSTRQTFIDKYGYDTKMSYHLLRLIDEIEQILTTNDIDLMRNRDECIAMRNGVWGSFEKLESTFNKRLEELESLLLKGVVPMQPQSGGIFKLLQNCIEMHYGSKHVKNTEYVSAKMVMDKLDALENYINRKFPE